MKNELTKAFEKYLYHAKELLIACSEVKRIDATIQMIMMGKDKEEPLVDDKEFRDIGIGISRATYYINKMKDIDEIEEILVKDARSELDPICDYIKKQMQILE